MPSQPELRACCLCSGLFSKPQGKRGPIGRYCDLCKRSPGYRSIAMWQRHKETRVAPRSACAVCGWAFAMAKTDQRYCSRACGEVARGRRRAPSAASPLWTPTCPDCGITHIRRVRGPASTMRCLPCSRRASKTRRQCEIVDESVTLAYVAERDGWRCHLCGERVDGTLHGHHRRAATIDHLIPISRGGNHVAENVALAHRCCNSARGNRGVVQLLLVG